MNPLFVRLSFGLINLHKIEVVRTAEFAAKRVVDVWFAGDEEPMEVKGDDAVHLLAAIDQPGQIVNGGLPFPLICGKDLPKKETS